VSALMPMVYANQETVDFGFEDHPSDQRQLAQVQNQLIQLKSSAIVAKNSTTTALDQLFWVLTFLVLIIERILSFRKQTRLNHVKG
jgi:hypothetical protein